MSAVVAFCLVHLILALRIVIVLWSVLVVVPSLTVGTSACPATSICSSPPAASSGISGCMIVCALVLCLRFYMAPVGAVGTVGVEADSWAVGIVEGLLYTLAVLSFVLLAPHLPDLGPVGLIVGWPLPCW